MSDIAILFPGQGSQERGMGKDVAEANPEVMELWKKAERVSKLPLREIYWDGDDSLMADTKNLQPALTVANLGLWMVLSKKIKPSAGAGHSLGEYSALGAAGVLPFETLLELVALRGRLMSEADPNGKGAMAAIVKMSADDVVECIRKVAPTEEETLVIANYNTPGQTVASGSKGAIERLQTVVKEKKGRAIILPVSGAFHSPLLQEAAAEMKKALDAVKSAAWQNARFPLFPNADPRPVTDASIIKGVLERQMTSSVHWIQTIRNQFESGCKVFVECGPKNVLSKMVGPDLEIFFPDATPSTWKTKNVTTLKDALAWG